MSKWQPIETAPKRSKWILLWCVFDDRPEVHVGRRVKDSGVRGRPFGPFIWATYANDKVGSIAERVVTHWMPLPPPPNTDSETE